MVGGRTNELATDVGSSRVTNVSTNDADDVAAISSTGEDDTATTLVTDGVTEVTVDSTSPELKGITGCEGGEEGSEVSANVTITDILLGVGSTGRGVEDNDVGIGTEVEVSTPRVVTGEEIEREVVGPTEGAGGDGNGCEGSTDDDSEGISNVNEGVSSMMEDSLEGDKGEGGSVIEDEVGKADSVKEGGSVEVVGCRITSEDSTVNVSSGTVDA